MRDLEELERLVIDVESRGHFHEAVQAYRAGAFRAALVETWVSISYDLINKFRFLAEIGEKGAKGWEEDLKNAIMSRDVKKLQEIENGLLQKGVEWDLLQRHEFDSLKRLYEDRNLCAHPAFLMEGEVFSPSAETVRYYLAEAVDNCLSLPPIAGKTRESSFRKHLESSAWPKKESEVIVRIDEHFSRARSCVKKRMAELVVKAVVYHWDPEGGDVDSKEFVANCRSAIRALEIGNSEVIDSAILSVIKKRLVHGPVGGSELLRLFGAVGDFPIFDKALGKSSVDLSRVKSLLEAESGSDLVDCGVFSVKQPFSDVLKEAFEEAKKRILPRVGEGGGLDFDRKAFEDFLDQNENNRRDAVGSLVVSLGSVGNFADAGYLLERLCGFSEYLQLENVECICAAIKDNGQIHCSYRAPGLMHRLYLETKGVSGVKQVWVNLIDALDNKFSIEPGSQMFWNKEDSDYVDLKKMLGM